MSEEAEKQDEHARRKDEPLTANPYARGTTESFEWSHGWHKENTVIKNLSPEDYREWTAGGVQ